MSKDRQFDFLYAAMHTKVVRWPKRTLETFDVTRVTYTLVAELDDLPGKVRIREGRLEANRPLLITPEAYVHDELEGFGEEARRFYDWLKENEDGLRILKYGYRLKQEAFSELVVSSSVEEALEQAVKDAEESGDPFRTVIAGVDDPWDVCLLQFFREESLRSVESNIRAMEKARIMESLEKSGREAGGEIEVAFKRAEADPSRLKDLGALLKKRGLFERYQDRFFKLVRRG